MSLDGCCQIILLVSAIVRRKILNLDPPTFERIEHDVGRAGEDRSSITA